MPSPAMEQFDRRLRSSTQALVHRSSARADHTGLLHPSEIPYPRSIVASSATNSVVRTEPVPLQLGVLGPRTAEPDHPGSAPKSIGLATANPLQESAPTPRAPALSDRGNGTGSAPLRKPPADNLVKSGRTTTLCEAGQDSRRRLLRNLLSFPEREQ